MTPSQIVIGVPMVGSAISVIQRVLLTTILIQRQGWLEPSMSIEMFISQASPTSCPILQIRFAEPQSVARSRISYIIFDGRIASPRMGWRWRKYRGSNPHRAHLHCSFTKQGDKDGSFFFNIPLLGGTE
jgi:hypothetical protein